MTAGDDYPSYARDCDIKSKEACHSAECLKMWEIQTKCTNGN